MTRYINHTPKDDTDHLPDHSKYIRISFKGNRRDIFLNAPGIMFSPGEFVIVEAENGEDIGTVTPVCSYAYTHMGGRCFETVLPDEKNDGPVLKIIRTASEKEISSHYDNRRAEGEAFHKGEELIQKNHLEMKLVDVEYQLDRKKITFFYTADERVDFRQLVKDLAYVFRTRIEMRQIGVRDYARRLDGVGPCGQQICCTRFLDAFEPVTTQYAKDQNLPINPSKLSGACGKLKCCLRFEWDFYSESIKDFPAVGVPVEMKDGLGTIVANDLLNRRVTISYENGNTELCELETVKNALLNMEKTKTKRKN